MTLDFIDLGYAVAESTSRGVLVEPGPEGLEDLRAVIARLVPLVTGVRYPLPVLWQDLCECEDMLRRVKDDLRRFAAAAGELKLG